MKKSILNYPVIFGPGTGWVLLEPIYLLYSKFLLFGVMSHSLPILEVFIIMCIKF